MRSRPFAFFCLWVFLPALATSAFSQSPPSSDTTFTSNSELVLVPVHVSDVYGRPMRGLRQENFVLKSDGNPQRVSIFEEIQPSTGPGLPPGAAAPVVPNSFSNLPAAGLPHQAVIVALDLVNTPVLLQGWAKTQTVKYLASRPPQQPLAIVAFTPGGLREVCSFTSDTARLIAAVNRVGVRLTNNELNEIITSYMDPMGHIDSYAYLRSAQQDIQNQKVPGDLDAGSATLHDFEQLAWAYSGVPGRKTVLWLTAGFPIAEEVMDGPTMLGRMSRPNSITPYSSGRFLNTMLLPQFHRAFTALNKSDVVVYPIDVKGLLMDSMWDVTSPAGLYIHPGLSHLYPALPNNAGAASDGMKELAHRTGGKTCIAGNNLNDCMERALNESSDYYLLGFYVSQQERKVGWHKLKVGLNVDHGEVRARSTYYLRPLGTPPEQEQEEDLRSAIFAGVDYTGVFFSVEPAARPADPKAPVVFRIWVPAGSVQLLPGQDKLSYDVIGIPLSRKGEPVGDKSRIVNIDVAPKDVQKALSRGWNLLDFVPAAPEVDGVKVIVRDNSTGRVGSVVFPLSTESATVGAKPLVPLAPPK